MASAIVLTWDVRRVDVRRWRVLRSDDHFAAGAFDDTVVGSGQSLVSDQPRPGSHDNTAGVKRGARSYTIFAEDELGRWHRAATLRVERDSADSEPRLEGNFEDGGLRPGSVSPHALDIAQSGLHPR